MCVTFFNQLMILPCQWTSSLRSSGVSSVCQERDLWWFIGRFYLFGARFQSSRVARSTTTAKKKKQSETTGFTLRAHSRRKEEVEVHHLPVLEQSFSALEVITQKNK